LAANPNTVGKGGKFGDLKRRLWFLLGALVVYRIGAHIPVPGIDPNVLADLFNSQQGGILGMFNMFSGGALSRFTIFALGIMPYISASIIMQLMSVASPQLEASQERGRGWSSQDYPIHALRHRDSGPVPGGGHCCCLGGAGWIGQ
jgi:preprotein translocase subunit SecY